MNTIRNTTFTFMVHTTKTGRHIDKWTTSTKRVLIVSLMNDNLTAQLVQTGQNEGSLTTVETNYCWIQKQI
jgi:hypothetical protein